MRPEELALMDSTLNAYKAALVKVGSLKRLTIAQRQQLAQAHSIVFGLLAQFHSAPAPAVCDAQICWKQVVRALGKVDPLWHSRGSNPGEAAAQAVSRLVDPDYGAMNRPTLRQMVRAYFEGCEARTSGYFHQLANRDIYKE